MDKMSEYAKNIFKKTKNNKAKELDKIIAKNKRLLPNIQILSTEEKLKKIIINI